MKRVEDFGLFRPLSPEERKQYRRALMRESLWCFFRPFVYTWGSILIIYLLYKAFF